MTFALVHGAWHGAWCFERLAPELESRGHRTIAMDLPSEDPDATFETFADCVVATLDSVDDEVVVVGHSLSGHVIPLVAARRPVKRLVYLCALLPLPGRSLRDQVGSETDPVMLLPGYEEGLSDDGEGRRRWTNEEIARRTFFADCDERVAHAAFRRLRPQASGPNAEPCPLHALPSVATTSIVCTEDRIVNPDWSRRVARERLSIEPIELPGSHSPFLSRPGALAAVLDELV